MKQFTCGDIIAGCGASFRAGTTDEVTELVHLHARIAHGLDADHLPAGFTTRILEHTHDVAA